MEQLFRDRKGLYAFTMIAVLFVLTVVCLIVSQAFFKLTAPLFFGLADPDAFTKDQSEMLKNPAALIYFQALCSSIGSFLLPALLYYFIFRIDIVSAIGITKIPSIRFWLLAIGIIFMGGIFIQWLVQLNSLVPLPDSWKWLRAPQEIMDKILNAFFSDSGFMRFVILVLVMAVLPAIAEEFFFRGTVQNILLGTSLGPTGAIVISGLAFSLIHFEFDNMLAIWCMGIILGCVYYYSGSIWVSIAAHFFNNFTVVIGKYAFLKGVIHTDITSSDILPVYLTLPAGAIMIYGLIVMRKWSGKTHIVGYN